MTGVIEGARSISDLSKDYQIIKKLGVGGFGKVYLLRHRFTKQLRAAKHQEWTKKDNSLQQVRREVFILLRLQSRRSEYIIRFLDYFEGDFQSIILTEYLSGGELFERISSKDYVLTEPKCRDFARQIFKGVQFIHKNRIIHLDLKPHNIILESSAFNSPRGSPRPLSALERDQRRRSETEFPSERLKIIDFGLARDLSKHKSNSVPISMCGTVEFISPEVMSCTFATFASDLWSVGIILYMMLSGGLSPFWSGNTYRTQRRVLRGILVNGGFTQPEFKNVSREAIDCIENLLKIKPEDRLTSDECLDHPWLTKSYLDTLRNLETIGIRRYLARRRWIRWFNTIRALNRMRKSLGPNIDSVDGAISRSSFDPFGFKNKLNFFETLRSSMKN